MAQTKSVVFLLLLAGFLASGLRANADTYGPVTFTLPQGWTCTNDNTSYVCLDHSQTKDNTSAIVVSFKNKSPEDSLLFYTNQLKQPRVLKDGEVTTPSEVKLVHELELNGLKWIEGVHLNSELKGYYTHYFITVVDPYAVLITVNVHESEYQHDMAALKPTIDSFRVTPPKVETPAATPGAVAPSPEPVLEAAKVKPVRPTFHILGMNIPKVLVYLAAGLILVIILLGYAIGSG